VGGPFARPHPHAYSLVAAGKLLSFSVTLKNVGAMDADEVVQVYLSDPEASVPVPIHKLVGFRRVHVSAGKSKTVRFSLPSEVMLFVDANGDQKLEPGQFRLTVGSCSSGPRGMALGAPESVNAIFTIT
jgi:beta-glucosidase